MDEIEATEFLLDKLSKTKTNDEFFEKIKKPARASVERLISTGCEG